GVITARRRRVCPPTTPAATSTSPLSLHDALPISNPLPISALNDPIDACLFPSPSTCARQRMTLSAFAATAQGCSAAVQGCGAGQDRKSTRLNSSHSQISYAVFCLKKKKLDSGDGC